MYNSFHDVWRAIQDLKRQIACNQCCNDSTPTPTLGDQNNRVINVDLTSTSPLGTTLDQLILTINTTYGFTVPEDVNVIFTFTADDNTTTQYLFNPGKGTYGFGNLRLVNVNDFTPILIPASTGSVTPDILVNSIGLTMNKKKREKFDYARTQELLPEGETSFSTRNGFIAKTLPIANPLSNQVQFAFGETLYETKIQNLWLKVEGWDRIKDYNPQIVLTRYRYTANKGQDNLFPSGGLHYRKGGYKLNNGIAKDGNGSPLLLRPAKIPITTGYPIIDFGQEHYFKARAEGLNTQMLARGNSKHKKRLKSGDLVPYIYFELRVQITVDSVDYMSKGLMRFRMEFRPNNVGKLEVILREV